MARFRYNLVETALAADIDDDDTTITLATALQEGGVDIATVSGSDILAIRIGTEIMHVTAYTPGATSATVDRGMEDTIAAAHFAGEAIKHVITKDDIGSGGGGRFAVLVAASDSTAADQEKADFVCTGTDDDAVFQSIIDTFGTGGLLTIECAAGNYSIDAQIDVDCVADVTIVGNIGANTFYGTGDIWFDKTSTGDFSVFSVSGGGRVRSFIGVTMESDLSETITSPTLEVGANCDLILRNCAVYQFGTGTQPAITCIGGGSAHIEGSDVESNGNCVLFSTSAVHSFVAIKTYFYADVDYALEGTSLGNGCNFLLEDCWLDGGGVRIDGDTGSLPMPVVRVRDVYNYGATTGNECLYLSDISVLTIDGGRFTAAVSASCVRLSNVDSGVINGLIIDNVGDDIDHHGIWMLDCEDIVVTACNIEGYGRGTDATYSGILLDGDTNRCQITNNHLRHGYGSGNMPLYGIRVDDSTCDDNLIKDNYLLGASKTNGNEISDAGTNTRGQEVLIFALSDETTAIASTGQKLSTRMPYNFVLTKCRAYVSTASASGGPIVIDIEEGGSSVFTTDLLEIDDTELTSVTATQPNITDPYLADDSVITFDMDDVGDGAATGAKVALYGWRL